MSNIVRPGIMDRRIQLLRELYANLVLNKQVDCETADALLFLVNQESNRLAIKRQGKIVYKETSL